MLTVGLTGGIGSGKSLIAKIFIQLGIPVFNADAEAGIILDEDLQVRTQLLEWLGPDAYMMGKPNRQKIAGIIFNDPEALSRINELIHPKVRARFIRWCGNMHNNSYIIHEAAILFESGFNKLLDTTILVTAPEIIRIERVKRRDNISEESIRHRMQNQWSDEQKSLLAGYIIINDETTPLLPKVLEIHNKLTV